MSEWKNIDSAPKDGTPILLYLPKPKARRFKIVSGYYYSKPFRRPYWKTGPEEHVHPPTHWRPLPEQPLEGETK